MMVDALYRSLADRGFTFTPNGPRLRIDPTAQLTADDIAAIRANRDALYTLVLLERMAADDHRARRAARMALLDLADSGAAAALDAVFPPLDTVAARATFDALSADYSDSGQKGMFNV